MDTEHDRRSAREKDLLLERHAAHIGDDDLILVLERLETRDERLMVRLAERPTFTLARYVGDDGLLARREDGSMSLEDGLTNAGEAQEREKVSLDQYDSSII